MMTTEQAHPLTEVLPRIATRAKRYRTLPSTLIGAFVILGVSLLLAFFPSLLAPYDPTAFDYSAIMQGPRVVGYVRIVDEHAWMAGSATQRDADGL